MTKDERKFVWLVAGVAVAFIVAGIGMVIENVTMELAGAFSAALLMGLGKGVTDKLGE